MNDLQRRLRSHTAVCTVSATVSFRLLGIIAVSAVAAGTPLASALAANSKGERALPKGDLVVTFGGSGGGTYRFHKPAVGGSGASACRVADTTYAEIDSYRWSYRFVLPPAGGSSTAPSAPAGRARASARTTSARSRCASSPSQGAAQRVRRRLGTSAFDHRAAHAPGERLG